MKFMSNIKTAYAADADVNLDRGDIVQTILLIAGFAIVTILAVNWIGTAILNKGADVAVCIESLDTYASGESTADGGECEEADHAADNSFTNDAGYEARY